MHVPYEIVLNLNPNLSYPHFQVSISNIWDDLNLIPDPCKKQKKYMKLFKHVLENEKIIAFRSPPDDWFSQSQILGIDFEGSPPTIAQIACEKGVFISRVNKPKVIEILKDPKHIHCVFGKHEEELVGNPLNLQIDPHKSLVEYISITFCPEIRFKKDKKIHKKVGYWKRYIPDFGLRYAALDAEMTRLLGMIKYSENTNPFSGKIKPFNIDTEAVFQKFKKLYNS